MSTEESEKVSVLTERIDNLIKHLEKFETDAGRRFVTRDEFSPVQRIVYGGTGLILCSVLIALVALVLNK